MMWILLMIILIILVFLIKLRIPTKRILIIFVIIIGICLIRFLTYYFKNIYINPNWLMEIERTDIDGFSNKVYVYSNHDVIIEYYPSSLYPRQKVKLNENIDLEKVHNFIINNTEETNISYKIIINSNNLHKEDKVVYISSRNQEIQDFIQALEIYMTQIK